MVIKKIAGISTTLVLAIVSYLWINDRAHGATCQKVQNILDHGSSLLCGDPDSRYVKTSDADGFVATYLRQTASSDKRKAWRMLLPDRQKEQSLSDYQAQFDSLGWAELIEPVKRSSEGFNRFDAHVREYWAGATAGPRRERVKEWWRRGLLIRLTSDGLRLADLGDEEKLRDDPVHYSRVTVRRVTSTWQLPKQGSGQAMSPDQYRKGGQLLALCQGLSPSNDPNPTYWTRTPQGWIQNSDLTTQGRRALPGILLCAPLRDQ